VAFVSGKSQSVVAPNHAGKINAFSRELTLESRKILDIKE